MRLDELTDYYCNTELLDEIRALLAPSYAVLGSFIMRGLTEPIPGMEAQLLLLRDEAGQLATFCKFGYHMSDLTPCLYIGLTAVHPNYKDQGLGRRLWERLFQECRRVEAGTEQRILVYLTTANSSAFKWFARILAGASPTADGYCDAAGQQRLQGIAAKQYPQATWDAATPYLLRRAAPGVSYSESEYLRVQQLAARESNDFFNSLAVDERNGDRMLVVGFAPDLYS